MANQNQPLPLAHISLPKRRFSAAQVDQSGDLFTSHVGPVLRRAIESSGWAFTCGDATQEYELSAEEVAAADGLLSVVVDRAREMAATAMGWKVDLGLLEDPKSLSECAPEPQGEGLSPAMWVLLCHAQLEDLVKSQPAKDYDAGVPVSLTAWYTDFMRRKPGMAVRPQPARPASDPGQRQGQAGA